MSKFFYIASLLVVLTAKSYAIETKAGQLSLGFTWGALYDSNVLRYSEYDRQNYLDEVETFKSPIRSLDDIRTDYKVSAELQNRFWQKRNTTVRLTADFAHHLMNPIKNLGWISVSGRQDFSRHWIGNVNYFFEPRYYIRDYTDAHTNTRQNCEFALHQLKADLTFRPKWLFDFTGSLKLKDYRYNEFFTEYDGDLLGFGLSAVFRPGDWRFAVGYNFETFDNSGFTASLNSSDDPSIDDSEFGQGDYDEDIFTGSVRRSFSGFHHEMSLQVSADISRRAFTTSRSVAIDPMHSGREDWVYEYSLANQIKLTNNLSIELGIGSHVRDSEATKPNISDLKDFNRYTASIEISYELK